MLDDLDGELLLHLMNMLVPLFRGSRAAEGGADVFHVGGFVGVEVLGDRTGRVGHALHRIHDGRY